MVPDNQERDNELIEGMTVEDNKPAPTKSGNPVPKGFIPWVPGQSGNISGRPKMTKEQRELWDNIRSLGPKTYKAMLEILDSNRVQAMAKVRVIEIILSYILGKPEANVNLNVNVEERIASSELRIAALVQTIKKGGFIGNGEPASLGECPIPAELPAPDREQDRIQGSDDAAQPMD